MTDSPMRYWLLTDRFGVTIRIDKLCSASEYTCEDPVSFGKFEAASTVRDRCTHTYSPIFLEQVKSKSNVLRESSDLRTYGASAAPHARDRIAKCPENQRAFIS